MLCETEDTQSSYESYFITGCVKSVKASVKGVVYDEIPFNLYKALEKRNVKKAHYLYCQKGMKILVTVFETDEDYPSTKQDLIDEIKAIIESFNLNYRVISRSANGEFVKFEAYLPHNKSWIPLAELLFSENIYTRPFRITGKSAQVNINLENILLSQIGQGFLDNPKNKEELPAKSITCDSASYGSNKIAGAEFAGNLQE
jgi:hypothetical protein